MSLIARGRRRGIKIGSRHLSMQSAIWQQNWGWCGCFVAAMRRRWWYIHVIFIFHMSLRTSYHQYKYDKMDMMIARAAEAGTWVLFHVSRRRSTDTFYLQTPDKNQKDCGSGNNFLYSFAIHNHYINSSAQNTTKEWIVSCRSTRKRDLVWRNNYASSRKLRQESLV